VFVALAAEFWWAEREDRRIEREMREDMAAGFDPEMGAMQSMSDSGNLTLVSDRGLRPGLARWSRLPENRHRFNLQAVQFQHREVLPALARAAADGRWSASERRELQIPLNQLVALFDTVVDNQRPLLTAAQDIRVFLQESD
jgi:hypothetical protein